MSYTKQECLEVQASKPYQCSGGGHTDSDSIGPKDSAAGS